MNFKRYIFLVLVLVLTNVQAQVKHVILISIDGFRPEMFQNKGWPSPNLQRLAKEGTYAGHLKSVFPAYTYPSHTAMITGALPARSSIVFNQPKNSTGDWDWYAKHIKVPTLWQVLKKNGISTAAITWPVTAGADVDWIVPEIWDEAHPSDRITRARKYSTPGLVEEIELNATGKLDSTNFNDSRFSWDENIGRMAAYILKTKKPRFLAVHFANVDDQEHDSGREADSVRMALATDDHAIGDIMEAMYTSHLQDSTAIIIVGDHGFADINQFFRPNTMFKSLPVRFIPAGGSAFLYHIQGTKRLTDEQAIKQVTDSLNKLPKDKRNLFRIIDRKELDQMGADSAAILALAAQPGLVFSGSTSAAKTVNHGPGTKIQHSPYEGLFGPYKGGHHGYDPNIPEMYTGFIAWGQGINKGKRIEAISEPDIAPLIARLLQIEFNTPDGKLVPGIVKQ